MFLDRWIDGLMGYRPCPTAFGDTISRRRDDDGESSCVNICCASRVDISNGTVLPFVSDAELDIFATCLNKVFMLHVVCWLSSFKDSVWRAVLVGLSHEKGSPVRRYTFGPLVACYTNYRCLERAFTSPTESSEYSLQCSDQDLLTSLSVPGTQTLRFNSDGKLVQASLIHYLLVLLFLDFVQRHQLSLYARILSIYTGLRNLQPLDFSTSAKQSYRKCQRYFTCFKS